MATELHRKVLPGWHHARTCDKTVRSLHCAVDDVVKKQAGFVMDLGHIMHMQARWAWYKRDCACAAGRDQWSWRGWWYGWRWRVAVKIITVCTRVKKITLTQTFFIPGHLRLHAFIAHTSVVVYLPKHSPNNVSDDASCRVHNLLTILCTVWNAMPATVLRFDKTH